MKISKNHLWFTTFFLLLITLLLFNPAICAAASVDAPIDALDATEHGLSEQDSTASAIAINAVEPGTIEQDAIASMIAGSNVVASEVATQEITNKANAVIAANAGETPVFPGGDSPFYLYVEKGSFSITVFGKDAEGNYSVPLRTFPTAIGRSSRMTPTGIFYKGETELWHSWGSTYSPYTSAYVGNLYVHGPIYGSMNFDTLSVNSVTQIGSPVSSGCLRTTAQAAYFFYEYCPAGTPVHIVDGSPYGFYIPTPSVDEQYIDPAGMTLDDLFPGYSFIAQNADGAMWDELWDDSAHYAWQKKEAYPDIRMEFYITNLELAISGDRIRMRRQNEQEDRADETIQTFDLKEYLMVGTEKNKIMANDKMAILWISTDTSVARVDSGGVVYGVRPGKANVIALGPDGITAAICRVTVSHAPGAARTGATQTDAARTGGGETAEEFSETTKETGDSSESASPLFTDLDVGHWAAAAVSRLGSYGVIEGNDSGFAPDDDITKVEFIKMLTLVVRQTNRSAGKAEEGTALSTAPEEPAAAAEKPDVTEKPAAAEKPMPANGKIDENWYMPYLAEAEKYSIINADERHETELFPDEYLTREEFCLWIGRAENSRLSKADTFIDYDSFRNPLTAWRLVTGMYINGFADGSFHPSAYVTRAVAAQTLLNIMSGGSIGAYK